MSEAIHGFLAQESNAQAIDHILAQGIELATLDTPDETPLAGLKFVFTGGMEELTRGTAKKLVEQAGARAVSSVSRETDYVVAGDDPGSKYDRAVELGVTILDEQAFIALLRDVGIEVP